MTDASVRAADAAAPATATPTGVAAFRAYLAERFPVPVTLMLAVATATAAYAVAQAPGFATGHWPLLIDDTALGGVGLVFLLLFHLRVFDEHKDFAEDARTRPDRPVQRGLVTLAQLKVYGAIALALEIAIALAPGLAAGWWWALVIGYSVLMLFEFFAPRWLERHFGTYAISHSAIMSVVVLALVMRFAARSGVVPTPELIVLAVQALASTFSIDVLRKTWAQSSELDGVMTWSKQLGRPRAGVLGGALLALAGACAAWLGVRVGGGILWIGVVAGLTGACIVQIRAFVRAPTAKGEKGLQAVAGVHYLVVWTGIAVVAAIAH
ncbi:MAG: UbiA family prenyltransferase, partial [Myxococcales bacterium]|nr:UbiA family prenyltransferase [Myxococcales bacterium]